MIMRRFFLTAASIAMLGAGCARMPEPLVLPTVPPESAAVTAQVEADGAAEVSEGADAAAVTDVSADAGTENGTVVSGEATAGANVSTTSPVPAPAPPPASVLSPYYIAYTDEGFARARADGRPILLYFWASWCPICRAEEPGLKELVEAMDVPVAGFRVDFDVRDDLKAEYGVPYQHTTIILDTKGTESVRFGGPVPEEQLRTAIRAAAAN